MPIPQVLRTYADDARAAFRHTPVEVLMGLLVAVTFSVTLRNRWGEDFFRMLVPAAIALPLVFGLSVLRARGVVSAGVRWGATLAVLAAAALYGALVFDPDLRAEVWRALMLAGAAWLALSLAPMLGRERSGEAGRPAFWRFNAALVARIVTVALYGGVLFAALAGAVAAVVGLFELQNPKYLYGDLFGWIAFGLVPWVVAGGLPDLAAEPSGGEEAARAPRPVRLLGRCLYAPVLAIYLVILLAYTLRVAATGEFPKNLLSPIVLLAGLGGFLGALLLEPLRTDREHRGVAGLVRVFPAVLLLLLPLAFVAVLQRQGEYGWTEFRYLRLAVLAALAALAVAGTLRLVRRRPPLLRTVPLVLGAVLLLSAVGPWSASAVSRRDQTARLRAALEEAGLLRGGVVPLRRWAELPDSLRREVPRSVYDRVQGGVTYLSQSHGNDALRPLFPHLPDSVAGWSAVQALGIRPGCEERPEGRGYANASLAPGTPVPGVAGGTLYEASAHQHGVVADTTAAVRLRMDARELRVTGGAGAEAWTARVDLGPLVARLLSGSAACGGSPDRAERLQPGEVLRELVDERGRPRGQLILTMVAVSDAAPAGGRTTEPARPAPALQAVEALVVLR